MTTPHPPCRLCRDGTYATMSLRLFPEKDCEWTHYCDPCGVAMASVIRDGQNRDPENRRLPTPPAVEDKAEVEVTKKPKKAKAQPPPPPPPPAPKPPAPKPAKAEGYDLLALLGMKK